MPANSPNTCILQPYPVNLLKDKRFGSRDFMAYAHYLIIKGQLAGNLTFDGHKPTVEEQEIRQQCLTLCRDIKAGLSLCNESEIPELLERYDLAYCIAYGHPLDKGYKNSLRRRVFTAWSAGNKEIEESVIFDIASADVRLNRQNADREYIVAYQSLKEKWISTLLKHNRFIDATTYENYQRLSMIMKERISDMTDAKEMDTKRKWYESNRVDDLTALSSMILRSYRRFAASLSCSVISFDEQIALDKRILAELSTRPDLAPHDREAYRLSLKFTEVVL